MTKYIVSYSKNETFVFIALFSKKCNILINQEWNFKKSNRKTWFVCLKVSILTDRIYLNIFYTTANSRYYSYFVHAKVCIFMQY